MGEVEPLVIVGGGIAGLALAALVAERGQQVLVLEAADSPAPATGGAFLNVAPNGMRALAAVGVAEQVGEVGRHSTAIEFRNHLDRRIGAIDTSDEAARLGVENRMVRRADLHAVLRRHALRRGAKIHDGHRLLSMVETPDRVLLDCGTETIAARRVIGADGVHSRVRRHVCPDVETRYLGLVDIGGFCASPAGLPVAQQTMWFGRRAFFGAYRTPDDECWWFCNIPRGERPDRDELRATATEDWLERARRAHRDDPPLVREILRTTGPPVGAWPAVDLPGLATWHTDRVCLIGDAAHASSPSAGQGASLALEDAVELAPLLAASPSASSRAFASFQDRRIERVDALVRSARRNSNRKAPGPVGRLLRDVTLPLWLRLGARDVARAHAWTPTRTTAHPETNEDTR